ncbi:MAG: GNAT family N-acetyltransferase [Anaerolineaceae bacterium]|nr:GNAT family N-acetyltransferase [Anaerolineaceae bacterium]
MIKLIKPTARLKNDFLKMIEEYRAKSEFFVYHDIAMISFQQYLDEMTDSELGKDLKPGLVPQTTFWLVKEDAIILGESRLRHYLTPDLELEGGHIGYAIRPSQRLYGFGTEILRLTLPEAGKLGLDRVLVTCDADNIGSSKIILANGGIFDGEGISKRSQKIVHRYWVPVE